MLYYRLNEFLEGTTNTLLNICNAALVGRVCYTLFCKDKVNVTETQYGNKNYKIRVP